MTNSQITNKEGNGKNLLAKVRSFWARINGWSDIDRSQYIQLKKALDDSPIARRMNDYVGLYNTNREFYDYKAKRTPLGLRIRARGTYQTKGWFDGYPTPGKYMVNEVRGTLDDMTLNQCLRTYNPA